MKYLFVIFVTMVLFACGGVDPGNIEQPYDGKFQTGLYVGQDTAYGFDVVAHVAYLHADGRYEFYEFKKIEDADTIVCWRQTHGRFIDSGEVILFSGLEMRNREIDSLKTVANPWSDWEAKEDRRSEKRALYDDYGPDFFVLLDLGGDARGNYWSMNVRSRRIGPENQPSPFAVD
jgi:hypothetical protein